MTTKVRILNFFRRVWMIPFLESFLASKTRGLPPNHVLCKFVPNPYQYSPGALRIFERDGIKMRVDISDYIGHYLYFGFDDPSMRKLFSLCLDTSYVVDIGTNIGWTALRMAKRAGHGKVFGFEPDPYNFERCMENVKLSALNNIEVYPLALGNREATVGMEVRTPSNWGGNRIAPQGTQDTRQVQLTRLDDIVSVRQLEKIDLIKIDVEGYELEVLRGALNTLRKYRPALFIELDDNNLLDQGDSASMLVRFLEELGYTITHAENDSPITAEIIFDNCHFDIVAR